MGSSRDDIDEEKDASVEPDERSRSELTRRSILQATGAAAAVGGGLLGTSGTAAASTTPEDFQFDRVLNAVDDLGADPTGSQDVVPLLKDAYQSGTKIEFPPGTYKLGSKWLDFSSAVSNFGIVGTGTSQRDVQFLVPDSRFNDGYAFGFKGPKSHHLFKNFSIQQGPDGDRLFAMLLYFEDGLLFENVEWLGVTPDATTVGDSATVQNAVGLTTQDGVGVFRRCQIGVDAPGLQHGYPTGLGWLFMGPFSGATHRGEVRLEHCRAERQGANPTRHDAVPGVITVIGGYFRNNDNANLRLAGGAHPTKNSLVDGATIVVDGDHGGNIAQALHVDNSHVDMSGLVVKNTDIVYTDTSVRQSQPVIAIPSWGNHGSVTFKNCRVRNENSDALTLNAGAVDQTGDLAITIEDSDFTGAGQGIRVDGRPESVIRNSCFGMENGSIEGTIAVENVSQSGCERPDETAQSDDESDPEPSASVSTGRASNVNAEWATLHGSLDELTGLSSVNVCMECREAGTDSWRRTDARKRSEPGEFSTEIEGLSPETNYEYRASVVDETVSDTGTIETFSTGMPTDARTLVVRGTGSSSNYEITVTGELTADSNAGDVEEWDEIDGGTVTGWVTDDGDLDTYLFTGEVSQLLSDGAAVFVDGERVDSGAPADRRTLKIRGSGSPANYEITVSGELTAHSDSDDLEAWDRIDGSTAAGWVTNEGNIDTFAFTGEISDLSADGAVVAVDGERISDGTSEPERHTLTIEGTGSPANYEVTVSGELTAHPDSDDLEAWDEISGSTATGWVTNESNVDTFAFTGELTALSPDGAAVSIDGERVDPAAI